MGNDSLLLLQGGLFIALLFAASLWDLRKRVIPDTICVFIALTGLFILEPMRLSGVFAAVPLLLAALIWDGMGGGDIKLMAATGLVLGLPKSMAAIIMGLTALLVFHAIRYICQNLCGRDVPRAYPLAPFLSLGCLAAYFLI
jgi:leader peptidase (prepilin peptidase)/N-methyltransferase